MEKGRPKPPFSTGPEAPKFVRRLDYSSRLRRSSHSFRLAISSSYSALGLFFLGHQARLFLVHLQVFLLDLQVPLRRLEHLAA